METRLLDLLVCPICKGPLEHLRPPLQAQQELVCHADRLAFPVRDGIPIMLEAQARHFDPANAAPAGGVTLPSAADAAPGA